MKKILPIIIIAAIIIAIYVISTKSKNANEETKVTPEAVVTQNDANKDTSSTETDGSTNDTQNGTDAETNLNNPKFKSASDIYANADDAFNAIMGGIKNYDDAILDQFASVGDDCTWCNDLYERLRHTMLEQNASENQRSYIAEILATSGKIDNLAVLIDAIKDAKDEDTANIYSEALELASGNDDVVKFLGSQLATDNKNLKESIIAALTNHGSPLAIDMIYKETVESNDPDGFYSQAIGLGEVIPNEDSLPYLTELANRHDDYSHLAIKALLNYGPEGLRTVVDIISQSDDLEANRKLLKDAIDHVSYEDSSKEYAEQLLKTSKNQAVLEFAEKIVKEFEDEEEEEEGEGEEEEE